MRVVIYKGKFQYDVVTDFGFSIGEELTRHGAEVIFIDLNAENVMQDILKAFQQPVDFVIGFNGIGCDLQYQNQSLYDYVNTAYILWLVDHPVHLMKRIQTKINNKIVVCIDNTHADYIERYLNEKIVVSFIPHGVNEMPLNQSTEKKYKITFAGHINYANEYESEILKLEQIIPNLKGVLDKCILDKGNVDLKELIETIYKDYPLVKELTQSHDNLQTELLYIVDRYIRATKRNYIIEMLLREGITIDFFGKIPNDHPFLNSPHFNYHGIVEFREMKSIFQQSKFVLNILPNFPNGGHERIFTSMMCGAIPLTDTNKFIENYLPNVISFNIDNIKTVVPDINSLLSNEIVYSEKVFRNYENAIQSHTWFNRLEELLYVVQAAKQYWAELV